MAPISVRRQQDGSYAPVNGRLRLDVTLEVEGEAEVIDIATGAQLFVHKVNDQLLVLDAEAQANVEDLVVSAINRAKR